MGQWGPWTAEGQGVGQWDTKGGYISPPPALTEGGRGVVIRDSEDGASGGVGVACGAQHHAVPPPPHAPPLAPALGTRTGTSWCHLAPAARQLFRCPRSCPSLRPRGPATAFPPTLLGCWPEKGPPPRTPPQSGGQTGTGTGACILCVPLRPETCQWDWMARPWGWSPVGPEGTQPPPT